MNANRMNIYTTNTTSNRTPIKDLTNPLVGRNMDIDNEWVYVIAKALLWSEHCLQVLNACSVSRMLAVHVSN